MTLQDAFTIVATTIASVGGAGLLILALSSWLGRVWADRLMVAERAKYEHDLEALRAELQQSIDKSSQAYRHKLELYQDISEPVIELVVEVETSGIVRDETMSSFEHKRLNTTAMLGMFASSEVFDAYNNLIDYMFDSLEGKREHTFSEFRVLALRFLSEVRRDIGFHTDDLTYKGTR